MAVTNIIPRWQGRKAEVDENGVRVLSREWAVETNDPATGEPAVIDAVVAADASAGLYAPHPLWPRSVCRGLSAEPNGGPKVWTVKAKYSSARFAASGDGTGGANPSSPSAASANSTPANERPPTVKIVRKEVTKPLEYDAVDTDPETLGPVRILNPAGDPFDPPPEVFRSHHLISWTIYRRPADLDWPTRAAFMDSVNDAAVTVLGKSYPAGTLRCTEYSPTPVWETGAGGMEFFWQLDVQAEYDPEGWQPEILATGRRQVYTDLDGVDHLVAIVDDAGQPVADPVPLDADGYVLAPGAPYHYVTPKGYVPKNWAGLLA